VFVALLYLLSFLDRSSTAPSPLLSLFLLADNGPRHRQCPSCWHGRRLAIDTTAR
jgi:hypothetical protein